MENELSRTIKELPSEAGNTDKHLYPNLTNTQGNKVSYCLERMEQGIPGPLRCFKCQRYGHHMEGCRGHPTCGKGGQKDTKYREGDYPNETKRKKLPTFPRSYDLYKKREIVVINETL